MQLKNSATSSCCLPSLCISYSVIASPARMSLCNMLCCEKSFIVLTIFHSSVSVMSSFDSFGIDVFSHISIMCLANCMPTANQQVTWLTFSTPRVKVYNVRVYLGVHLHVFVCECVLAMFHIRRRMHKYSFPST